MYKDCPDIVKSYLNTTTRNKIIFFRGTLADIEPVNIGKMVAEKLTSLPVNNRFSLKAKLIIDEVFTSCLVEHNEYGKYIAISNFGILFEPNLKIDVINLFDRYSSSNALFIKWQGEMENKDLFFLSKQHGFKLVLNNISHITI